MAHRVPAAGGHQPFVVSERNGVWGQAIQVPGLGTLTVQLAYVWSVSCASPGNCAAGGAWEGIDTPQRQGFVTVERNGVWGQPTTASPSDGR
jgi:hypothetical protein